MKIVNHRLVGARYQNSPNQGGVITPKFIVMHYTAGFTLSSAVRTLTNPNAKVSAQFVIDTDGTIVQLVDCNRRAWHAGPSKFMGYTDLNSHSIGIELVNPGFVHAQTDGSYLDSSKRSKVSKNQLAVYPTLVEQKHPRLGSKAVTWTGYPQAQLDAASALVEALCAAYSIQGLASHEEVDNRGWKTDPGPLFPLDSFKLKVHRKASAPTTHTAATRGIVNTRALNARTGPSTEYVVKRVLTRGTPVTVIRDIGDWSLISVGGEEMWVFDKYLRLY